MSTGKIIQVIGPVVDIQFPAGKLPAIYNAIHIPLLASKEKPGDGAQVLTVEVALHLGDEQIRAIALGRQKAFSAGWMRTIRARRSRSPWGMRVSAV